MERHFEHTVVQNVALGATALWYFSSAYYAERKQAEGPTLIASMLVLPLVFHRRTATAIHAKNRSGGLLKAMREQPEIPAGLQRRLQATASTSLQSLNVAIGVGLLEVDPDQPWPRFTPRRTTPPADLKPSSEDVKVVCHAAQRLGWWFAGEDFDTICNRLRVRF